MITIEKILNLHIIREEKGIDLLSRDNFECFRPEYEMPYRLEDISNNNEYCQDITNKIYYENCDYDSDFNTTIIYSTWFKNELFMLTFMDDNSFHSTFIINKKIFHEASLYVMSEYHRYCVLKNESFFNREEKSLQTDISETLRDFGVTFVEPV